MDEHSMNVFHLEKLMEYCVPQCKEAICRLEYRENQFGLRLSNP